MLDLGRGIAYLDVGYGVRAAAVADQQRVALRVVACALRPRLHPNEPTIGVLAAPGRNALRDDRRTRVAPDMDHLRAGVGLLAVVGDRDRIEFANRVVAFKKAARIFPGDRRAGLEDRKSTRLNSSHQIISYAVFCL